MAKPLRIGVIGLGNMGAGHCRTLQGENTPELKLTAVSTRRAQRRAWAEQGEFAVPAFPTAEALTGSGLCDAVLVAVPHYQHAEITIDALRQGLYVLCEKPAAVSSLAAREMVDTAREQGKALGVIFNQRTNSLYREMKRLLSSGEMGAVKRVNWIITDWYRPQAYYNSGTWRATWQEDGGRPCCSIRRRISWICCFGCAACRCACVRSAMSTSGTISRSRTTSRRTWSTKTERRAYS